MCIYLVTSICCVLTAFCTLEMEIPRRKPNFLFSLLSGLDTTYSKNPVSPRVHFCGGQIRVKSFHQRRDLLLAGIRRALHTAVRSFFRQQRRRHNVPISWTPCSRCTVDCAPIGIRHVLEGNHQFRYFCLRQSYSGFFDVLSHHQLCSLSPSFSDLTNISSWFDCYLFRLYINFAHRIAKTPCTRV